MVNTLLLGLLLAGTVTSQLTKQNLETKSYHFVSGFTEAFGFSSDMEVGSQEYNDLVDYYKDGCVDCLGRDDSKYAHPNACNLFISCVKIGNTVLMYGHSCPAGLLFDERYSNCFPANWNQHVCERVGNPCRISGMKIPVDNINCGEYQTCDQSYQFTRHKCERTGYGFNAKTGECDWKCPVKSETYRLISEKCTAAEDDDHMMVEQVFEVTAADGTKRESRDTRLRQCSSGLKHLRKDICLCDRYNDTSDCEDLVSVHLSSSDNSWFLARNNTPVGESSAITGNGTVTNSSSQFPNSAYFHDRSTFFAHAITGNDLGLRFSFSFNFLVMTGSSSGISVPRDGISHNDFALADNSICGIDPTYGCKLTVTGTNKGRVICYVKPQNMTDFHREVESDDVDLSKRITVYFAKDNENGVLLVKEGGDRDQRHELQFPPDVRAEGNSCPLTIAAGTKKRYFRGFMDDMELVKHCNPFL